MTITKLLNLPIMKTYREPWNLKILSAGIDNSNKVEDYKNFIKDNLKLGVPKDQVVELFGNKYTDVLGPDSEEYGKYHWRYDFLTEGDYHYYNELDEVDIDGLTLGRVKIILFIAFNKEYNVQSYSYYYYDKAKECISEFRIMDDGTIKEGRIADKSPNVGKVDILQLPPELLDVYNRYFKKPDDQLLKGLNPLDVCRLYFYAEDKKNYETMYALYIHDEKYLVPTKEEFLMDVKNDKVSRVNDEKLYRL